jgi:hypothetical protein
VLYKVQALTIDQAFGSFNRLTYHFARWITLGIYSNDVRRVDKFNSIRPALAVKHSAVILFYFQLVWQFI